MTSFSPKSKVFFIIGIVVVGVLVASWLFVSDLMQQAERDKQFLHLKEIDIALSTFAKNHGQQYPQSLEELQPHMDLTDEEFQKAVSNLEYYGEGMSKIDSPRLLILATKPVQGDRDQSRIVLRNDNSVRLMDKSDFEKALSAQQSPE